MEEKKYVASDFTDSPMTRLFMKAYHKDGVSLSDLEQVDITKINPLTSTFKTVADIWIKQDLKKAEEARAIAMAAMNMEEENDGENL